MLMNAQPLVVMRINAGIRRGPHHRVDSFVEKRFTLAAEHHGFNSEFLHAGYVPDKRVRQFFFIFPVEHAPVCASIGAKIAFDIASYTRLTSR